MSENAPPILTPEPATDRLPVADRHSSGRARARPVVVGIGLGLAWGASLRAWMALLAVQLGEIPQFTWSGTFAAVLLPAALVGALVGGAYRAAGVAGSRERRWVLLSPILFVLGSILFQERFIATLLSTGMGGGAIGVALIGILGGYARAARGVRWLRWVAGFLAAALTVATIVPVYFVGEPASAMPSASKAFGVLLFVVLMALLIVGVSAPARRRRTQRNTGN